MKKMATFNLALLRSITILYVEDEITIRDQSVKAYSKLFKEVLVASNGEEAIEVFEKNKSAIDIILSDINMPKLSGLNMSKAILKDNDIPIILTTAHSEKDLILEALDIGVKKYSTKPTTLNTVVQNIEEVVTQHRKDQNIKEVAKTLLLQAKNSKEVVHELLSTNKKLEEEKIYYKSLVDAYISMVKVDKNGIINEVSKQFAKLLEYRPKDLIGHNISMIKETTCPHISFQKQMLQAIHKKTEVESQSMLSTKNNKIISFDVKMVAFYGADSLVAGYNLYFNQISKDSCSL